MMPCCEVLRLAVIEQELRFLREMLEDDACLMSHTIHLSAVLVSIADLLL